MHRRSFENDFGCAELLTSDEEVALFWKCSSCQVQFAAAKLIEAPAPCVHCSEKDFVALYPIFH